VSPKWQPEVPDQNSGGLSYKWSIVNNSSFGVRERETDALSYLEQCSEMFPLPYDTYSVHVVVKKTLNYGFP